jgi:hypothetical protein
VAVVLLTSGKAAFGEGKPGPVTKPATKPAPVIKGTVGKVLSIPDEYKKLGVVAYFTLEKPEGQVVEQVKKVVVTVYDDARIEQIEGGKRVAAKPAEIKEGQRIQMHGLEEGIRIGDFMRIAPRSVVVEEKRK